MTEPKTEPGYPLPRARRPWWAVAMAGGFGAVLAVLLALGIVHGPATDARGDTLVRTSGISAAQQNADEAAWRARMETKVDEALQRIAHIEGRMDRGR